MIVERQAVAGWGKAVVEQLAANLQMLAVKDAYTFDFLELGEAHSERELERALITRIEDFLRAMAACSPLWAANTGWRWTARRFSSKGFSRSRYTLSRSAAMASARVVLPTSRGPSNATVGNIARRLSTVL